jgi:hypothetical protein
MKGGVVAKRNKPIQMKSGAAWLLAMEDTVVVFVRQVITATCDLEPGAPNVAWQS